MNNFFILISMIFCHIIADYNLQGWLAQAKQKSYWEKNAPEKMYKNDYIMALLMHSLSWTYLMMLPLAIYSHFKANFLFAILLVINSILHFIIDDLKANKHKINLIIDQILHIGQIFMTFFIYMSI